MKIKKILINEALQIRKLQELVDQAIQEEQSITQKLLEVESEEELTFSQQVADAMASFGGSWKFIITFGVIILAWVILNVYFLKQIAFDPYPFILLNLLLSCIAALQAPVIMMSQNRQEEKDRIRAKSNYMINLKSEIEVRNLHCKIDVLITEQMKALFEMQQSQIKLLAEIEQKIKSHK